MSRNRGQSHKSRPAIYNSLNWVQAVVILPVTGVWLTSAIVANVLLFFHLAGRRAQRSLAAGWSRARQTIHAHHEDCLVAFGHSLRMRMRRMHNGLCAVFASACFSNFSSYDCQRNPTHACHSGCLPAFAPFQQPSLALKCNECPAA